MSAVVSTWVAELARAAYVPMSRQELTDFLERAARRLTEAVAAPTTDLRSANRVGTSLVDADLIDSRVLPNTVATLARHLPELARSAGAGQPEQAAAAVQAALVHGYLTRMRARILDEQEMMRQAEVHVRREMAGALRSSEARFSTIFASAAIGIGIADTSGRIIEANAAFATILGYSAEELRRFRVSDLVHPQDAPGVRRLYRDIVTGSRVDARVEKRCRHREGHNVWTGLTLSLIRSATGAPLYTVAMIEDITSRHELEERLRRQALHDPLTLLANRTLFTERLTAAFARPGSRVGICYLDLDRFKAVNDRLGHHIGDTLLVAVAKLLDESVSGRGHLVARMGGDEFVILVENPPPGELAVLADSVLAALTEPVQIDEHQLAVSASIGVVECGVDDMTATEALKAADVTLYWAKSDGRNRWAWFDPDLVADVAHILRKTELPPRLLQLELTESALLGPAGRPVEAITALAAMGIRIAVDDFGTGYSNLGYLPRLPLHTMKLAGVLIDGLRQHITGSESIVASLISLAHALGLAVTAEGVETQDQAERLRIGGCDTAQGWLYSRAVAWDAVTELLDDPLG